MITKKDARIIGKCLTLLDYLKSTEMDDQAKQVVRIGLFEIVRIIKGEKQ